MLLVASFVAALLLLSCGGGDTNGTEYITVDGDPGHDVGATSDVSIDAGDDVGADAVDGPDDGCELPGYDLNNQSVIKEHPDFWYLRSYSADRAYFTDIFIYTSEVSEGDRYEFGEVDGEPSDHLLVVSEICSPNETCDTFLKASEGAIEIDTVTSIPGIPGDMTGQLVDIELVEGDIDAAGRFRETWAGDTACVQQAAFRASMDEMQDFAPTCDSSGFEPDPQLSNSAYARGVLFARVRTPDTPRHTLELITKGLGPGTYPLNDFRLGDCEACLFLYEGCETQDCQRTYAAGAGVLEITQTGSNGDRFVAKATGVEMAEAYLDTWDEETHLVEGGAGWCIDEVEWDLIIGQSSGD